MARRDRRRVLGIAGRAVLASSLIAGVPGGAPPDPGTTLLRQGVVLGVAVSPFGNGSTTSTALASYENATGTRAGVVGIYRAWSGTSAPFDSALTTAMKAWSAGGRIPMITWEPWNPSKGVTQPTYTLRSIATGKHDPYIRSWALGLAAYGRPVYLRPMHEMNSTWYPWAGGVNGNTPADYVAAWRHVHAIFDAVGAGNVRFVWSVNRTDAPTTNKLEHYWPGADTVDVLGIDGYTCYSGWTSFADVVRSPYTRLTALDPSLPVWVTETGACPPSSTVAGSSGHTRAEWITAIGSASALPRLTTVVYFDVNGGYAWRLDGDAAAARAVRDLKATVRPGAPAVPAAPRTSVLPTSVALSWPAVAGATSYRVFRDGVPTLSTLVPSATDTVLDPTTHSYSVAAIASGAMSAQGPATSTASAPAELAWTATTDTVTLTWQAVEGATAYRVTRDGAPVGTATDPTFTDTGRTAARSAVYGVTAEIAGVPGGVASTVTATTRPLAVTGLTAAPLTTRVTLSWSPVAGATSYVVRRGSTVLAAPTTSPWADPAAPSGTTSTYSVTARTAGGEGDAATVTTTTTPATPTGLTATAQPGAVTLVWNRTTGAAGYRIYRDGSTTPLLDATATGPDGEVAATATDTRAVPGTTHSYTVAAYSGPRQSAKSPAVTVTAR